MLKLNKNSLFAILLRSPWWASALVAVALAAGLRLLIPTGYAVFAALPFAVIAAYVGWQQLRAPSAERLAATLERLRAMPWEDFSAALEAARRAREAHECIYVAAGEITGQAREFAAQKTI